jgi:hypothetical protein
MRNTDGNFPIVSEPDQPDDFTDVLDSIEFWLKRAGMSWSNERVVDFVNSLHAAAGYIPATYDIAKWALSYRQLKAIKERLEDAIKEDFQNAEQPNAELLERV